MNVLIRCRQDRRSVVGMAVLAALGAASLSRAGAQGRSVSSGIVGGGSVPTASGAADFSLFATRAPGAGGEDAVVSGHLRWVDPGWEGQGLTLVGTEVTDYGPADEGDPENRMRVVRGRLSANGEGDYPFELWAFDAGPDRFGEDTITLVVGPAAIATPTTATPDVQFAYLVKETNLTGGNLELLGFDEAEPGSGY